MTIATDLREHFVTLHTLITDHRADSAPAAADTEPGHLQSA